MTTGKLAAMLHPSTKRLIDKLSDMTRKQRVTWTEGENGTIVHDTEGYRVVLTPEPHAVLLTDALGREIETCRPEEFADDVDSHGRPYSKFIAELYREASRHGRGTEKAIRALLAGLDEDEKAPAPEPEVPVATVPAVALLGLPDATTDETAPLESETEITAAVATLADKINGAPPYLMTEPQADVAEPEAASAPEPEPVAELMAAPEPALEPVPEPEPEPVAEAAPAHERTAEPPAAAVEVAPLPEEPGSFGTFGAFQGAQLAVETVTEMAAPDPVEAAPDPEPEPEPELAPEPVVIEVAPEPAPEPAAAPAMAVPTLAQPISLSSIPFGFGLGAAQRTGAPAPEQKPPVETQPATTTEPPKRVLIDGTLDLPEAMPVDYDDAASAEPYPPPVPQAGTDDLQNEPAARPVEPGTPRRFNPWN